VRRSLGLAQLIEPSPTGEALDEAPASHRGFLDAWADSVPLTQAGNLRSVAVRTIAPNLPTMRDWIFAIERDPHEQPVLDFREHLTNVRLLREAKSGLTVTFKQHSSLA